MLRYCIAFEWTKQIHFICLHMAMELSAAYVLGLYWELVVLLFFGSTTNTLLENEQPFMSHMGSHSHRQLFKDNTAGY